ncbi:hypothetical protein Peur_050588 [Populus x canadensis]
MDDTNTSIILINHTPVSVESPNLNNLPFGFKLNETNFKICGARMAAENHGASSHWLIYTPFISQGNLGQCNSNLL